MKRPGYYYTAAVCLVLVAVLFAAYLTDGFDFGPGTSYMPSISEEICMDYYYNVLPSPNNYFIEELSLRFRGVFSDTYVVFVDGPFEYEDVKTEEYVSGLRFAYPDSQTMLAYHQGNFYSLAEAYNLGFLTKDNLVQLRTTYAQLGADRTEVGDIPIFRQTCTHTPKEPTEPTEPIIITTEPTVPTETTEPTEPIDIMAALPDIPPVTELCAKPEVMNKLTLVSTIYDRSASWLTKQGIEQIVTVQLPAIVPFCEGAIEINESIRNTYQYWIESVRQDFKYQRSSITMIYFKTSLQDNILTIRVAVWEDFNVYRYSHWMLDISTGKQLQTPELAQMFLQESYPVFMHHCTNNLIEYFTANPLEDPKQQSRLIKSLTNEAAFMGGYNLYLGLDGTLLLDLRVDAIRIDAMEYNAIHRNNWDQTEQDSYHWLFNLWSDGAGAEELDYKRKICFFQDPHTFVKMLSQEDDATITSIAQGLNYSLYYAEEIAYYTELCDNVYICASDEKIRETATILLNALQSQ